MVSEYKTDWSNWVFFFDNMVKGKVPHSSKGFYIVDDNAKGGQNNSEEPVIKLVTPVAQTLSKQRQK